MEGELNPAPKVAKSPKWRQWLFPVLFTSLLYVGLGLFFWSYNNSKKNHQLASVIAPAEQLVVNNTSPEKTVELTSEVADDIETASNNQDISSTQIANQQIQPTVSMQSNFSSSEPIVVVPVMQSTDAMQSHKELPLSDEELEAERQNDLLRQAIEQVRQINEQKLAQTKPKFTSDDGSNLQQPPTQAIAIDQEANVLMEVHSEQ